MYLTRLKAAIVDALNTTFDSSFLPSDLRGTPASIDYPMDKQAYPSIWVNYEDQDSLRVAGIAHREYVHDDPDNPASPLREITRWMYSGEITLTIAALTSLERDNLYDQFVRVFAFSRVEDAQVDFRTLVESNPFLVININYDELRPHGDAASPGTPWGTEDEVIYEKSIGFDVVGEFFSDPSLSDVALLSEIRVTGTNEDDPDEGQFTLGIPRTD